jgi:HSP90 family molecular chaperone
LSTTTSQNDKDETTRTTTTTQEPKLDEPKQQEQNKKQELPKESLQFQAETRQLLDIVTHSLYTDKEVFLRELVSNASDALEKLRHLQVANIEGHEVCVGVGANDNENDNDNSAVPLEIRIETDELNQTLTITDTGIGLTRDDMISNLGTIAKSGSKAFLNEISKATSNEPELDPARGIIGKFGVGFYSAFMVGDKVEVRSK